MSIPPPPPPISIDLPSSWTPTIEEHPPIQVYRRRQPPPLPPKPLPPPIANEVTVNSSPNPTSLPASTLSSEPNLPITLCKGIRSTHNPSTHYVTFSTKKL